MAESDRLDSLYEQRQITEILPTHSDDGIDLTLIRWMLSMTPAERLQTLQQNIASLWSLRGGKAAS